MPTIPLSIPKLGAAMTEATLVEWLVDDGAPVEAGQAVYRLETDKVEQEIEAPVAGVLRIVAQAGEVYAVGTPIGEIQAA